DCRKAPAPAQLAVRCRQKSPFLERIQSLCLMMRPCCVFSSAMARDRWTTPLNYGVTWADLGKGNTVAIGRQTAFKGSITALVTPFQDGRFDEDRFHALVDWQIVSGTHGLVPVGTTGESPTLSHEEHRNVIAACVSEVKGR